MSVRLRTKRGDEFVFDVTVTKNGEVVDLADLRVHFFAKRTPDGLGPPTTAPNPIVIHKSTVLGGVAKLPEKGRARITLDPADTLALPNETKHYIFDVKVKEPDGSVFTVLMGELIVFAATNEVGLC